MKEIYIVYKYDTGISYEYPVETKYFLDKGLATQYYEKMSAYEDRYVSYKFEIGEISESCETPELYPHYFISRDGNSIVKHTFQWLPEISERTYEKDFKFCWIVNCNLDIPIEEYYMRYIDLEAEYNKEKILNKYKNSR